MAQDEIQAARSRYGRRVRPGDDGQPGNGCGQEDRQEKRGILTDTIGLILAVTVTTVGLSENALEIRLLDQANETYPTTSSGVCAFTLAGARPDLCRQDPAEA